MEDWSRSSTTSQRLREAMDAAKMKQADLARATGLSKGGISNYVMGRYEPKSDIISKLAIALKCSEMWLMGYDVPKERIQKSPDEPKLTEGEEMLLKLFRQIPEENRGMVLEMIRAAVRSQE